MAVLSEWPHALSSWQCSSRDVHRIATHGVSELGLFSELSMFWNMTLHTATPLVSFYNVFTTPASDHSSAIYVVNTISEEMIFFYHLWRRFWSCIVFCRRSWRWRMVRMDLQAGWRHLLSLAINPRRTLLSLIHLLWMLFMCTYYHVALHSRPHRDPILSPR